MTKEQFYNDPELGEKRKKSGELDFGVWWRGYKAYPTYRITWVENTGEIIKVSTQNEYEIIGRTEPNKRDAIEAILKGWAKKCGELGSLNWVKNKF